ncbi:MAG TPA: hypothetical protein VJ810_11870 [Blastocatellia bacterium]|nr:hypothetical protein [Blastocatellia bacterium]
MLNKKPSPAGRLALSLCAFALCFGGLINVGTAQDQEDNTSRRFWPPSFRPAATRPAPAAKTSRYKRTTPPLPQGASSPDSIRNAVIGITVWRLRPSNNTDNARILVKKNGKNLTPERVEAVAKFSEGQALRLSIEIPRTGYLYVIDREQYADGSFSIPYLIFPHNPGSNVNRVTAGRVVEIPNQTDDQAYFEVEPLREGRKSRQTAEVLTVIVSSTPLKDLPKGAADGSPLKLPEALVEKWEKEWSAQVERLEKEDGAGAAYTTAEQAAGASSTKRLTQDDPLPQTIFRVAVKPGKPLMVKLPLKIGE